MCFVCVLVCFEVLCDCDVFVCAFCFVVMFWFFMCSTMHMYLYDILCTLYVMCVFSVVLSLCFMVLLNVFYDCVCFGFGFASVSSNVIIICVLVFVLFIMCFVCVWWLCFVLIVFMVIDVCVVMYGLFNVFWLCVLDCLWNVLLSCVGPLCVVCVCVLFCLQKACVCVICIHIYILCYRLKSVLSCWVVFVLTCVMCVLSLFVWNTIYDYHHWWWYIYIVIIVFVVYCFVCCCLRLWIVLFDCVF